MTATRGPSRAACWPCSRPPPATSCSPTPCPSRCLPAASSLLAAAILGATGTIPILIASGAICLAATAVMTGHVRSPRGIDSALSFGLRALSRRLAGYGNLREPDGAALGVAGRSSRSRPHAQPPGTAASSTASAPDCPFPSNGRSPRIVLPAAGSAAPSASRVGQARPTRPSGRRGAMSRSIVKRKVRKRSHAVRVVERPLGGSFVSFPAKRAGRHRAESPSDPCGGGCRPRGEPGQRRGAAVRSAGCGRGHGPHLALGRSGQRGPEGKAPWEETDKDEDAVHGRILPKRRTD